MPIEVTARHMHTSDDLQDYARRKAEEILEALPIIEHIRVILDLEKHGNGQIAEVVLLVKHHGNMEAAASTDNLRASVDMAFDKIEKQVRKLHDKDQDHKSAMKHGRQP